jgi:hypothetical protein
MLGAIVVATLSVRQLQAAPAYSWQAAAAGYFWLAATSGYPFVTLFTLILAWALASSDQLGQAQALLLLPLINLLCFAGGMQLFFRQMPETLAEESLTAAAPAQEDAAKVISLDGEKGDQ